MDLAEFDIVPAAIVPVFNPKTGEPLKTEQDEPITLLVAGVDTDTFHERQYALADKRTNRKDISPKELDEDRLDTLTACLQGWAGIMLDGKEVPYSPANARALLQRLPWLANQVDVAIVNRAIHFKTAQPEDGKTLKAKGRGRAAA
jgi:hypothetical protein